MMISQTFDNERWDCAPYEWSVKEMINLLKCFPPETKIGSFISFHTISDSQGIENSMTFKTEDGKYSMTVPQDPNVKLYIREGVGMPMNIVNQGQGIALNLVKEASDIVFIGDFIEIVSYILKGAIKNELSRNSKRSFPHHE